MIVQIDCFENIKYDQIKYPMDSKRFSFKIKFKTHQTKIKQNKM